MNVLNKFPVLLLAVVCAHFNPTAGAEKNPEVASRPGKASSTGLLEQLSSSLKTIARQVEPSVVQIFRSTLSIENDSARGGGAIATRQRSSGSGVLISSDGYIITKGHVVDGARRLRVRLDRPGPNAGIISVRSITPSLAQGLNLPTDDGVLVEDIAPHSTAETAGLKVGDVITKVNSKPIQNVRQLASNMYLNEVGDNAQIAVLRGTETLSFNVPVVERADDPQRFEDLVSEQDNSIVRLGILGLTLDEKLLTLLPPLRVHQGVLVAAMMAGPRPHFGDDLAAGDVICAINGTLIEDMASLMTALESVTADSPLVLQVERAGRLQFVVFEGE